MDIKTTLDNSAANYAKNLRDLSLQLNYDKGSTEAKVSINQFEFVKKEAELLLKKVEGEGLGVMFGVPYRIELGEKGNYETILDGMVDLTNAEKFSCREVIAPVIDKGGNDFLTQTADSFTFEFLFNRRPDLLAKTDYLYTPYLKNSPSNAEIANAVFSLILLTIDITNAIKDLVSAIAGLVAFEWEQILKIIVLAVYIFFLIKAAIQLVKVIIDMILPPVKYHACMSALKLCQIGAEYKGYQFASTILEGEFSKLAIIPPKNETIQNDQNLFLTGFTEPNEEEQTGFYQGTFGQLLRDLITMFNAKIIIEESQTGGQKIIRLERQDYNNSQKLYTMPDVDFDGAFKLNTDEFAAASSLKYLTDSADINSYQFYQLANVLEVIEPVDVGGSNDYCNLFTGYNETTIPFSMAVRKGDEKSRPEEIIGSIVEVVQPIISQVITVFNDSVLDAWQRYSYIIDEINNIRTAIGLSEIATDFQNISEIEIPIPDFVGFLNNRSSVMFLEEDQLTTHRVVMLESNFNITLAQSSLEQLEELAIENDYPFGITNLIDVLSNVIRIGRPFQNTLSEDNNDKLSAVKIYENFHQINSFYPSTDRPKGNQWKIYEVENVPFCYSDWQLLKDDNKFQNAQGQECLLESLEWNPFQNKANFRYRINIQYITNIQLKDGRLYQTNGK